MLHVAVVTLGAAELRWSSLSMIGVIAGDRDPILPGVDGWLMLSVISTSSPTLTTAPLGPAHAY